MNALMIAYSTNSIKAQFNHLLLLSLSLMMPINFRSLAPDISAILLSAIVSVVLPKNNQNTPIVIANSEQTITVIVTCLFDFGIVFFMIFTFEFKLLANKYILIT